MKIYKENGITWELPDFLSLAETVDGKLTIYACKYDVDGYRPPKKGEFYLGVKDSAMLTLAEAYVDMEDNFLVVRLL